MKSPNSLDQLISESIELATPLILDKKIDIKKCYTKDAIEECDSIYIRETLLNIIKNSIDAIESTGCWLHWKFCKSKIIMLSSLTEQEIMRDSFVAGAVNYLSKDDYIKIPDVIRTAIMNTSPFDVVLNEFRQLSTEHHLKVLGITPAEKEILDLIDQGYTQSQISKKLYKCERTIKNQINMMLKKLEVSSCKQAL